MNTQEQKEFDELKAALDTMRAESESKAAIDAAIMEDLEEKLIQRLPAEAGFSLTGKMADKHGAETGVTFRGATVADWPNVMKARAEFVEAAIKAGWKFPERGMIPAPNAAAPTPPVPGNGAPPVPPAPTTTEINESPCAMIEVALSYQGNKTQLKFYCSGLEHPLTFTKEIKEMVALLAPLGFTQAHIVTGQKYPVNCIVTWGQGEKYKNVIKVRPA